MKKLKLHLKKNLFLSNVLQNKLTKNNQVEWSDGFLENKLDAELFLNKKSKQTKSTSF